MQEYLRRLPHSAKWRSWSNYALKALDCIYFEEADIFREIDSDILFFRPFTNLIDLPDSNTDALFLTDFEPCYSVRSWTLLFSKGLTLGHRVNVGLICLRKNKYDPDLIEWFLSRPSHHTKPYFLEQTLWAMLAMHIPTRLCDPRQIAIVRPGLRVTDDLVAGHFVAMHRGLLKQYLPYSQRDLSACAPAKPRTYAPRRCTSLDLAAVETKRVAERTLLKLAFGPRKTSAST